MISALTKIDKSSKPSRNDDDYLDRMSNTSVLVHTTLSDISSVRAGSTNEARAANLRLARTGRQSDKWYRKRALSRDNPRTCNGRNSNAQGTLRLMCRTTELARCVNPTKWTRCIASVNISVIKSALPSLAFLR